MSDENNKKNGPVFLVGGLVLLAIAGLVYMSLKQEVAPRPEAPAPVQIEEPAPSATEEPPQPEAAAEEPQVLVETKKLDIPETQATEVAPAPANPDVAAMMASGKLGSDDAPIKVIEYSSLTCGHCASFHKMELPQIQKTYIDTGKVQFIFKEFPLNEPAVAASQILRCMPMDKYVSFMGLLFDQQENWAYKPDYMAALTQNAKLAGLTDEQIQSCVANEDLKKQIVADMQAASEKYEIQSTPTFIVNDGEKVIVGHQPFSFFEETFTELLPKEEASPAVPSEPEAPAAN